jgi:hypothetical protein
MAEPLEDKGLLTEKLEEDRQKMVVQTAELKEEYDVLHRVNASVQKNPLPWVIAALLVGFLLSRLTPGRKEVLVWNEPFQRMPSRKVPLTPTGSDNDEFSEMKQLLSLTKWAIGAYIIRILERRVFQPIKHAPKWLRSNHARGETERFLRQLRNWIEKRGQSLPAWWDRFNRKNSFLSSLLQRTPFEKLLSQFKAKPRRFWDILL